MTLRRLSGLVARLEKKVAARKGAELGYVTVNDQGHVIDDGRAEVRPWIGRHGNELPPATKVYIDFFPDLILRGAAS